MGNPGTVTDSLTSRFIAPPLTLQTGPKNVELSFNLIGQHVRCAFCSFTKLYQQLLKNIFEFYTFFIPLRSSRWGLEAIARLLYTTHSPLEHSLIHLTSASAASS